MLERCTLHVAEVSQIDPQEARRASTTIQAAFRGYRIRKKFARPIQLYDPWAATGFYAPNDGLHSSLSSSLYAHSVLSSSYRDRRRTFGQTRTSCDSHSGGLPRLCSEKKSQRETSRSDRRYLTAPTWPVYFDATFLEAAEEQVEEPEELEEEKNIKILQVEEVAEEPTEKKRASKKANKGSKKKEKKDEEQLESTFHSGVGLLLCFQCNF